jgi:hypothetical protein
MKENIFKFIVNYKRSHGGNSPTMKEIREHTGLQSNQSIINYLGQLQDDKRLILGKEKETRSIQVIGAEWHYANGQKNVSCELE